MRKDNRHPKLKPKASNPWLHVQGQTVDMPLKESEAIHCCPLIITDYAFIHSWSQAKSFNTIYWALKMCWADFITVSEPAFFIPAYDFLFHSVSLLEYF